MEEIKEDDNYEKDEKFIKTNNINEEEKKPEKNLSKKQRLIKNVYEIYEKFNMPIDKKKINKMKVIELEQHIGELMNKQAGEIMTNNNLISDETAAENMFNMSLILYNTTEKVVNKYSGDMLDGMTKSVAQKRRDFIEIYKKLIAENGDSIKSHMSTTTLLLIMNVSIIGECIITNLNKKKNQSAENMESMEQLKEN